MTLPKRMKTLGSIALGLAVATAAFAADSDLMVRYLVEKRVNELTSQERSVQSATIIRNAPFKAPKAESSPLSPPEPAPPRQLTAAPVHPISRHADARFPYSVQVKAERSRDNAHYIATKLRNQGVPAFTGEIEIPGRGVWHRVFIGAFETFEAADAAVATLRQGRFPDAFVIKTPFTIQIGPFASHLDLTSAKLNLLMKNFIAYPPPGDAPEERLLLGAFRNPEEARLVVDQLTREGFSPEVVQR